MAISLVSINRFREYIDFKVFRVRPRPLTHKGHLGSDNMSYHWKSTYDFLFHNLWTPSLISSYRFRDISTFNSFIHVLDNMTFDPNRSYMGSKTFFSLESPYMTSYIRQSMDTISHIIVPFPRCIDFNSFQGSTSIFDP